MQRAGGGTWTRGSWKGASVSPSLICHPIPSSRRYSRTRGQQQLNTPIRLNRSFHTRLIPHRCRHGVAERASEGSSVDGQKLPSRLSKPSAAMASSAACSAWFGHSTLRSRSRRTFLPSTALPSTPLSDRPYPRMTLTHILPSAHGCKTLSRSTSTGYGLEGARSPTTPTQAPEKRQLVLFIQVSRGSLSDALTRSHTPCALPSPPSILPQLTGPATRPNLYSVHYHRPRHPCRPPRYPPTSLAVGCRAVQPCRSCVGYMRRSHRRRHASSRQGQDGAVQVS